MAGSHADRHPARLVAAREGFSLAEMVAALTILMLLGTVLFGTLIAQMKLARGAAERALANDAVRSAVAIVTGEVRRTVPADVRALSPDSLALRSFRGLGLVCSAAGTVVTVRYRGDRMPDERKDSVLVVRAGREQAVQLLDARTTVGDAACPGEDGYTTVRLSLGEGGILAGDAAALLVFESGRYFLTSRALRYRLGAEGRQPLTAELMRHPETGFVPLYAGHAIGLGLAVAGRPFVLYAAPFAPPPSR